MFLSSLFDGVNELLSLLATMICSIFALGGFSVGM
jgi:hypothetical protein